MESLKVVDLFCGAGGGALGIHRNSGFETVFALDFWKVATETYKNNFQNVNVVNEDIHNLSKEKIKELVGDKKIDIVIGGPPCQGFSIIARHKQTGTETKIEMNKKNHLFLEFLRVCEILQPKIIVMENVAGILSMKNLENEKIINHIEKAYESIGYYLKYKLIDIEKLGLPQTRKRVIFIASKEKEIIDNFVFPNENNTAVNYSIFDAISDLENEYKQEEMFYTKDYNLVSEYAKKLRDKERKTYQDIFHMPRDKNLTKNRISQIKSGNCMKDLEKDNQFKVKCSFSNAYKREKYTNKIGTIVNVCKNFSIHPVYNRIYSVREIARLQNFPDSYRFLSYFSITSQYQLLANAIPPILTEHLFKEIKRLLLKK